MFNAIRRYLRPEIKIGTASELREGPAIIEGLSSQPAEPLLTPFRKTPCVAYAYTAYRAVELRQGTKPQQVRRAVAQGHFPVELSDGTRIQAHPTKPGEPMSSEDHRQLQAEAGGNMVVDEQPVRIGRRVRLEGMLKKVSGDWELHYKLLEDLGAGPTEGAAPPPATASAARRKARKSKKK